MKLYKDNQNNIYAYELDGSQDHLIGNKTAITQAEADTLNKTKQQNNFEKLTYSQKRASEYPPITDYIDGVVKGDQAQIDKYIADCLAVKAKYPKGVA
jgi:hypothetical protein